MTVDHSEAWLFNKDEGTFYWITDDPPGFVSYDRSDGPPYGSAALAVVRPIMRITLRNDALELLGLEPNGASPTPLTYQALNTWASELMTQDNDGCPLDADQARQLAQLGAALLNYDEAHLGDKAVVRVHPDDRPMIEKMIEIVILGLRSSESIPAIRPIDLAKLRAKQEAQTQASWQASHPQPQ